MQPAWNIPFLPVKKPYIGQSKTLERSIRWWSIDNLQCLTHIPYTTHYLGSAIVYCSGLKRCPYQSASGSNCTLPLNALTQKLGAVDMDQTTTSTQNFSHHIRWSSAWGPGGIPETETICQSVIVCWWPTDFSHRLEDLLDWDWMSTASLRVPRVSCLSQGSLNLQATASVPGVREFLCIEAFAICGLQALLNWLSHYRRLPKKGNTFYG